MPILLRLLLGAAVLSGLYFFSVAAPATSSLIIDPFRSGSIAKNAQKWLGIPFAKPAGPLDVCLEIGTFRGVSTANGTEKWLGIPFAEPPVGQLRFKAPVPIVKALKEIHNASSFGNVCPQPQSETLGAEVAEDCLFINVCLDYAVL
jgi:carboxylesterase type B